MKRTQQRVARHDHGVQSWSEGAPASTEHQRDCEASVESRSGNVLCLTGSLTPKKCSPKATLCLAGRPLPDKSLHARAYYTAYVRSSGWDHPVSALTPLLT